MARLFGARPVIELPAVQRHLLRHRAGRAGRLHRPQRRRQVDDPQDADRHPPAERGRGGGRGLRALAAAPPARAAHRHRLRPALAALVQPAGAQQLRAAAPHLRRRAPGASGAAGAADGDLRYRRAAGPAGLRALPRPAHPLRDRRRPAAWARPAAARRADHRAGRHGQGGAARPSGRALAGGGHHRAADLPRHRRYRDHLRPGDRHRSRPAAARRAAGEPAAGFPAAPLDDPRHSRGASAFRPAGRRRRRGGALSADPQPRYRAGAGGEGRGRGADAALAARHRHRESAAGGGHQGDLPPGRRARRAACQADRDGLETCATLGALAAFVALGWRRAAADRAGSLGRLALLLADPGDLLGAVAGDAAARAPAARTRCVPPLLVHGGDRMRGHRRRLSLSRRRAGHPERRDRRGAGAAPALRRGDPGRMDRRHLPSPGCCSAAGGLVAGALGHRHRGHSAGRGAGARCSRPPRHDPGAALPAAARAMRRPGSARRRRCSGSGRS